MTDVDYAPFPERELASLAEYHDEVATKIQSTFVAGLHTDRANACRNALAAHNALRDRFLEQSMQVRALQSTQHREDA